MKIKMSILSLLLVLSACIMVGCEEDIQTIKDEQSVVDTAWSEESVEAVEEVEEEMSEYKKIVSQFENISRDEALGYIEPTLIIVGRETCPYCVQYFEKIKDFDLAKENIKYLDSQLPENASITTDLELEGVPFTGVIQNGQVLYGGYGIIPVENLEQMIFQWLEDTLERNNELLEGLLNKVE